MSLSKITFFFVLTTLVGYSITNTTTAEVNAAPTTEESTTATTTHTQTTTKPHHPHHCEDSPFVDCQKLKPKCLDPHFRRLTKFCPKTCHTCKPCVDKLDWCEEWKQRDLCFIYPLGQVEEWCMKTCGLC